MAIKGSLGEASLGDVCQLLALGLKTGALTVTDRSRLGQIFFRSGRVVYAHVVNRRDRLGDLLVRDGLVAADALAAALDAQARVPRQRLGDLLVEHGHITRDALEAYVRRQIEEAVYHLFTWTRGTFFFEPDERPEAADILVSINPDVLLLEAARRVDEWALVERRIPTLDLVFEVEHAWLRAAGIELTEPQRVVVPLLDGTRSVREIIEAAGLDEFETGKAVYGLVEAGFAHRVGTRETAAAPKSPEDELAERRNLATAFFRTRMFTEARQEYDAILALLPDDLAARFRLGLIAVLEGRHRGAVRAFKTVLERGGPRYGAFIGLAGALRGLGRHGDALLVLDEAEALRPGGADVPLARGLSRLELGDIAAARADFATYAERLPDGAEPAPAYFYFAALAAALHGARDDARALTTQGLRGRPDASPLLLMMGLLEERAGNDARAAHWYGRAVAEDAACAHAHRGLGDIAQRASRPHDALAHYRRALEADPDLGSDVHTRIGNLLYNLGDFGGAVRHWNRALELDPADEAVRNNLEIVAHAAR